MFSSIALRFGPGISITFIALEIPHFPKQ